MNYEERKAEIYRRADAKITRRKQRRRIALGVSIPAVLCCTVCAGFLLPRLGPAAENMQGNMLICSGTMPAITAMEYASAPETATDNIEIEYTPESMTIPAITTSSDITGFFPDSPPKISLTAQDGQRISILPGAYRWETVSGGVITCTVTDSLHPLDPSMPVAEISTENQSLTLSASTLAPGKVSAECWPIEQIGNYQAQSQSVAVTPIGINDAGESLYQLTLLPGAWRYQLSLSWGVEGSGTGGTANYTFQSTYKE